MTVAARLIKKFEGKGDAVPLPLNGLLISLHAPIKGLAVREGKITENISMRISERNAFLYRTGKGKTEMFAAINTHADDKYRYIIFYECEKNGKLIKELVQYLDSLE